MSHSLTKFAFFCSARFFLLFSRRFSGTESGRKNYKYLDFYGFWKRVQSQEKNFHPLFHFHFQPLFLVLCFLSVKCGGLFNKINDGFLESFWEKILSVFNFKNIFFYIFGDPFCWTYLCSKFPTRKKYYTPNIYVNLDLRII